VRGSSRSNRDHQGETNLMPSTSLIGTTRNAEAIAQSSAFVDSLLKKANEALHDDDPHEARRIMRRIQKVAQEIKRGAVFLEQLSETEGRLL